MLDQAMSSASNGLIVLAVARVASVDAFGAATLLFAFAAAAMGIGRGALGTPIMLAAGSGQAELRREAGFATTTALVFGLTVSCAAAVAAFLLSVPEMGVAFAVAMPLVVVVDVYRYALISASKPHLALTWDAVWAIGSALLFVVTLLWRNALNDVAMVLCWAILAGISAIGMSVSYRLRPRFPWHRHLVACDVWITNQVRPRSGSAADQCHRHHFNRNGGDRRIRSSITPRRINDIVAARRAAQRAPAGDDSRVSSQRHIRACRVAQTVSDRVRGVVRGDHSRAGTVGLTGASR